MKPPIEYRPKLGAVAKIEHVKVLEGPPSSTNVKYITLAEAKEIYPSRSDAAATLEQMRAKGRARAKAYRAKKKATKA